MNVILSLKSKLYRLRRPNEEIRDNRENQKSKNISSKVKMFNAAGLKSVRKAQGEKTHRDHLFEIAYLYLAQK